MDDKQALLDEAKELGIDANPEWDEKYLKRTITMARTKKDTLAAQDDNEPAVAPKPSKAKAKTAIVKLLKNYVPKDSVKADGTPDPSYSPDYIVEVGGKYPGVGQVNKVWAGSIVKLPAEEARVLVMKRLAEIPADAIQI